MQLKRDQLLWLLLLLLEVIIMVGDMVVVVVMVGIGRSSTQWWCYGGLGGGERQTFRSQEGILGRFCFFSVWAFGVWGEYLGCLGHFNAAKVLLLPVGDLGV